MVLGVFFDTCMLFSPSEVKLVNADVHDAKRTDELAFKDAECVGHSCIINEELLKEKEGKCKGGS
jgi:hypothetical protein